MNLEKTTMTPKFLTAVALCAAAPLALAAPVNGGFESGLAGWSVAGDGAAVTGSAPEGLAQLVLTNAAVAFDDDAPAPAGAFNVSGSEPLAAGGPLEIILGLAPGALDPDAAQAVQAFEGSAAIQSFEAAAGSVLSFRWNFASNDLLPGDYAFVVIDGTLSRLADVSQLASPGGAWSLQSGYATFAHGFAAGGLHTVAFGVVDINDFGASSALYVDAVQLSAVPEPTTGALLALGLGAVALARRRRARG